MLPDMPCGDNWVENAMIRVEIRPNGQLDIIDKRTGKQYRGLHEFVDDAEVGDGWMHETPRNNQTVSGYGSQATVSRMACGFAAVTFLVEKTIQIPASIEAGSFTRGQTKTPLALSYTVTVKKDSPVIEIELEVINHAKDHRLRLMLPAGIAGEEYFAGQAFCCVQRKTGVTPGSSAWWEPECHEKNMDGIFGKRDADSEGLAFVSAEGLHECAAYDDPENTLAVTLFRSFGNVYLNERSEQAQLQGKLRFHYAIVPLNAETDHPALLHIRHGLAGMDMACSRRLDPDETIQTGHSYFSVDNANVQLSIFKCAQDGNGYILRLYNASEQPAAATLSVRFPCKECFLTNLNEENKEELAVTDGCVPLTFGPWEIRTLRMR